MSIIHRVTRIQVSVYVNPLRNGLGEVRMVIVHSPERREIKKIIRYLKVELRQIIQHWALAEMLNKIFASLTAEGAGLNVFLQPF